MLAPLYGTGKALVIQRSYCLVYEPAVCFPPPEAVAPAPLATYGKSPFRRLCASRQILAADAGSLCARAPYGMGQLPAQDRCVVAARRHANMKHETRRSGAQLLLAYCILITWILQLAHDET